MSQTGQTASLSVRGQLKQGERIVSNFGPYYATSDRILLYLETSAGPVQRELPYADLERIEEVKVTKQKLMILGTAIALGGFAAAAVWGIVVLLISLLVGISLVVYGGISRPAYYQLHGRGVSAEDMPYWQVRHHGAGSFLSSIRTITGDAVVSEWLTKSKRPPGHV